MISRILEFSVHQRWVVVFLSLMAAAFGVFALQKLPIDAVPDVTNNQVQINTVAPWLSPQDVEKQVTFQVETALAGVTGLEYTRSLSRNGFSQVTAVFSEKTDIYFARQQVNERLREAKAALPSGVEPRMGPISTGLGEIYMWTLSYKPRPETIEADPPTGWQKDGSYLTPEGQRLRTDIEQAAYLRTVQNWIVRPQVKMVPGIAGVDSIGGFEKLYQVQPEPNRLIAAGVSFADLAAALEANNANRGAGYIERNGEAYVVRAIGRLETLADIENVVIASRGGVPIRVKNVAQVSVGADLRTGSASANGREVVVGTALMLIGGNSRTAAAAVDAKIGEIARNMPPDVMLTPVLNRMQLVDATVQTVAKNLAEGALLVIAVLFLLLGNLRAALISALVIPFAMLMTFTGMVETKVSANLMSLGALDFGLIVDGAVIVTENALRRLAERRHALGRALRQPERMGVVIGASQEMIRPSLYGQAIIILVYVPLLTFTGVEGKMFQPMALTVIIALVAAFVLSLTLVPALIAIAVPAPETEEDNRIVRALRRIYRPSLAFAMRAPLRMTTGAAVLFLLALLLFGHLGQEFIPTLDEKNIAMNALRIPSASLSQSQAMQSQVEKAIAAFPEVKLVFSKTGTAEVASDPMPVNSSDTFIILKPQAEWPDPQESKEALQGRMAEAAGALPGNVYEFSQPIQMRFNELLAGVRGDVAIKVFGDEFEPMLRVANQIAGVVRATNGAQDVKVEQINGLPFLEISVDKEAAARFGLNVAAVQDVIGAAVGGREAGYVFEGDRRFALTIRLGENLRSDIDALKNLPVPLPGAGPNSPVVLMKQIARFEERDGPNQISRENGKRRVVVTANVRGRDVASVVSEIQQRTRAEVPVPPGYWLQWGGQYENLLAAKSRLMVVTPACFAMILFLLFAALGRVRDALLVFSAVPLAMTGGIAALWSAGLPFSVSAAVGFIALSGIAVLNGLVLLTYVKQLQAEGMSLPEALRQGALTRLRPVVMTALVAALGFVPMALATGTGAEVQKPLAIVVIGGLISATLLTLLVLPALYLLFGGKEREDVRGEERAKKKAALELVTERSSA
ncbi:CusA/CzcA family heavy metal efflux RND transporter [Rhodoblastus sp.]|jgi:cobalt-zinc-cadmium resistance protein CzcA|uniref:efflux RND transporter permease subunit n=1 Tax=Rhodoblastus sp. TaxID=1962975 RepID=UPI0025E6AD17|nr:CusA/CzcA family heavy metal efflux RND transporter [Rhodoblastus sp.]